MYRNIQIKFLSWTCMNTTERERKSSDPQNARTHTDKRVRPSTHTYTHARTQSYTWTCSLVNVMFELVVMASLLAL